jgi:N-acetylmuramoyl-L-alanine amidase
MRVKTSRFLAAGLILQWLILASARGAIIRGPATAIATRSLRMNGTLYIPVPAILRAYGLSLFTTDGSRYVFASDRLQLEITPGSPEAKINGETVRMDGPAAWVDGALMVPIYLAIQTLSARFPPEEGPATPPGKGRIRVVLDPGHGGIDSGAVGEKETEEKAVVMEIARRVKTILEKRGFEVAMTRDTDVFIPLRGRARLANRRRAEIFVSIHANAAYNQVAEGVETFYYAPAFDFLSQSLAILENAVLKLEAGKENGEGDGNGEDGAIPGRMLKSVRLAQRIQNRLVDATEGPDRGVKGAEFYVLKYTRMPSILVETGFLSNKLENGLLQDAAYRVRVAESIAAGIADFFPGGGGDERLFGEAR